MQIILPPWELQVHVAKDNGILRDDFWHQLGLLQRGFLAFLHEQLLKGFKYQQKNETKGGGNNVTYKPDKDKYSD